MNEHAWQTCKPEIKSLYIDENWTLSQVTEYIESKYGLRGTKTQYEKRLKKWGLCKNLKVSDADWKFIGWRIHKRKLAGKKSSEVYKHGKQVPPGTVRSAVYGGKAYVSTAMLARERCPSAPDGIFVCSPVPPTKLDFHWDCPLPWLSFSKLFFMDQNPHQPSASTTITAPSHRKTVVPMRNRNRDVRGHLSQVVPWGKLACLPNIQSCARVESALRILMPEDRNNKHDKLASRLCQDEMSGLDWVKIELFLASNFLGLDDAQVMETIRASNLHCLANFQTLLAMPEQTAAAVAEKLFASALRELDSEIVSMMLDAGMDPNRVLPNRFFTGLTFLQHAAGAPEEKGRKVVELLLSHGANPNLTFHRESALHQAIQNGNTRTARVLLSYEASVGAPCLAAAAKFLDDMDLFKDFLAACPEVDPAKGQGEYNSALAEAVLRENHLMTNLLLQRGADPRQSAQVSTAAGKGGRTTVIGLAIQTRQLDIIRPILRACRDMPREEFGACAGEDDVSPLALAAESCDPALVRLLVQAGADVRTADESQGLTLMECAVEADDFHMCRVLMSYGAPINRPFSTKEPYSALFLAVKNNAIDIVSLLLHAGARVDDVYTESPGTVLAAAIERGSPALVGLLLNAGAERVGRSLRRIGNLETAIYLRQTNCLQKVISTCGTGILVAAILSKDDQLAQFLLDNDIDVDANTTDMDTMTPLGAAVKTGSLSFADEILRRGARITDCDLGRALQYSLSHGSNDLFCNLLRHFSDQAPTTVGKAIIADKADMVCLLLSRRIDPRGVPKLAGYYWHLNSDRIFAGPQSVLEIAVLRGNKLILQTLLQSCPWEETLKGRALSLAVLFNRQELVEYLLTTTLDMNQEVGVHAYQSYDKHRLMKWGEYRTSPLQAAVTNQNASIVEKLLKRPATNIDFLGKGIGRRTALQLAVKSGDMEIVNMLLERRADVNASAAKNNGATALQTAAIHGFLGIARKLLELGANIDTPAKGPRGRSALEGAAENGRIDMVQMLLDQGASVIGEFGEAQYRRAVKLAEGAGHYVAAEIIRTFRHRLEREMRPVVDLSDVDGTIP
ncbi:ankyrin repeat-containing domain protein [Aspergillus falconensis]